MSSIYELMTRYVGRWVSITIHSHLRLIGKVDSVHEDGVLLTDTLQQDELEEQGWYANICNAHPEDDTRPRQAESLICWHAIQVVTCLDDDIAPPEPPVQEDEEEEDKLPAPFVIVNTGQGLTAHDVEEEAPLIPGDRFLMEIGVGLIGMMRSDDGDSVIRRIANLRREQARQAGWYFPPLRIRDNLTLEQADYRILIDGCLVAAARLQPGRYLAISSDDTPQALQGEETTDPAFGRTAYWIDTEQRQDAEQQGYTVVDPPTVIVTHLGEILRRYGAELLGYEQVQRLLTHVEDAAPIVVRELIDGTGAVRTVHYVLRRLLEEGISLRASTRILECLAHHKRTISDLEELTRAVRVSIGRQICEPFRDDRGRVRAVVFYPEAERHLVESCHSPIDDHTLEGLFTCLGQYFSLQERVDEGAALLVDGSIRYSVWKHLARPFPGVRVIAYQEIPADLILEPVHMIRLEELTGQQDVGDALQADETIASGEEADVETAGSASRTVRRQPR